MPEPAHPRFECRCCGLCCQRDPYYAVSLLDIEDISAGLGLGPAEFFHRYCSVVATPLGFRYPAILAPEGCPFLKGNLCAIHSMNPIGCRVFPESSRLPVTTLKRSVTAIGTCAILSLPDSELPLAADPSLMAARDLHFAETKAYFEEHEDFDEPTWAEATVHLKKKLSELHAKFSSMSGKHTYFEYKS